LKDLSATSHLKTTRLEESRSYRENIRDEKNAVELEEEQHQLHSLEEVDNALARLQERLKSEPENGMHLMRLGDLYLRKENYKFAMMAYRKSATLRPTYEIETKVGDLEIRLLKIEEDKAARAAAAEPANQELQAKKREARHKRIEFSVAAFEGRVEKHPTELPLRYEVGRLYFERNAEGDMEKATNSFQKVVSDPRYREIACFMLGRCFSRNLATRDVAIRQYELALKAMRTQQSDRAKESMYSIGDLFEAMGKKEEALAWFKKVYEIDANYKDVTQRINKLS
jgi:tetratricopeptide (TPR) repeat protein